MAEALKQFPVIDPVSGERVRWKDRREVHITGDWHIGVQANVIRPARDGGFEILIQKRSGIVDIGKKKYDQSLATQMILDDDMDLEQTLVRGLFDELGIVGNDFVQIQTEMRIDKTYIETREHWNREHIHLYVVAVPAGTVVKTSNPKVEKVMWMRWGALQDMFARRHREFTKTARFYFGTEEIVDAFEKVARGMIEHKEIEQPLADKGFLCVDHAYKKANIHRYKAGEFRRVLDSVYA